MWALIVVVAIVGWAAGVLTALWFMSSAWFPTPLTSSKKTSSKSSVSLYGLRNRLFNITSYPDTLWFNMGLWDSGTGTSFVKANENLAAMLARIAAWTPSHSILDCGYGCGDQDLYWSRAFPSKEIVGVTSEKDQYEVALTRVRQNGLHNKVRLYLGSATELDRIEDSVKLFDRVLSLDSAYHYNTRRLFFQQSFSKLRPGGKIALTDIILGPGCSRERDWWSLKFLSWAANFPYENMVFLDEYINELKAAGFVDIQTSVISSRVFPGLANFFKQHELALRDILRPLTRLSLFMMDQWLQSVYQKHFLDFIVVVATKPQTL